MADDELDLKPVADVMRRNKWLFGSLAVFVFLSFFLLLGVDKTVWFDESFSLETVQLMEHQTIDFAQYDVHPPVYYHVLSWWMKVPHGSSERVWARMLSVMLGVVFLLLLVAVLEASGFVVDEYGPLMLLMSVSTTFLYFATETRMYMLELVLAALALYALIEQYRSKKHRWQLVWVMALVLLPFTHYLSVIFYPVFLCLYWILLKQEGRVRWGELFIAGSIMVVSAVGSFLMYAWPQISRLEQLHLPNPSIRSYISALFYSSHVVAEDIGGWYGLLLMLVFVAVVFTVMWLFVQKLRSPDKGLKEKVLALFFVCGAVLPLIGFIGGFFQAYHHRYYFVVLWMFAVAANYLLIERWGKKALVGLLAVSVLMFVVMASSADHEAKNMAVYVANSTGCRAVDVVHQSTWTYLVFEVYKRDLCIKDGKGPGWNDYLVTSITGDEEISERIGRSIGEDAIVNKSKIGREELPYVPVHAFYYVDVGQVNKPIWNNTLVVWKGEGANITYAYEGLREPIEFNLSITGDDFI